VLKLLGAAVVGLTFAALALPASAGQVQKVSTQVEIWGADGPDEPPARARGGFQARFYGRVFADKAKCKKFRRVDLFGDMDGDDIRIGTGFSDNLGYWSITAPVFETDNGFYATASKEKRGKRTLCKSDRSPTILIAF
jgi:hypothetical protein